MKELLEPIMANVGRPGEMRPVSHAMPYGLTMSSSASEELEVVPEPVTATPTPHIRRLSGSGRARGRNGDFAPKWLHVEPPKRLMGDLAGTKIAERGREEFYISLHSQRSSVSAGPVAVWLSPDDMRVLLQSLEAALSEWHAERAGKVEPVPAAHGPQPIATLDGRLVQVPLWTLDVGMEFQLRPMPAPPEPRWRLLESLGPDPHATMGRALAMGLAMSGALRALALDGSGQECEVDSGALVWIDRELWER